MSTVAVPNTTILSNFASVGQLCLLRRLWSEINLLEQVYAEVRAGMLAGYDFYRGIERAI